MAHPPLEPSVSAKLIGASADRTPLPDAIRGTDSRVLDAWCEWLGALATDAEAALAAAIAYRELDAHGRTSWLNALEQDSVRLKVPRIAVYAPLFAVESDPERRDRITFAMGPAEMEATPRAAIQALSARHADGARIATIIVPLYLDFVQVLACAYRPERGFSWVRHDPIVDTKNAPRPGDALEGAVLERTPLKALIDELSHAVLSQRRGGREMPEALRVFADLFGPNIGGFDPAAAVGSVKRHEFTQLAWLFGAWALASCYARDTEPPAAAESDVGEPVQFTFGTLTGDEVSSDTTRGRTTALLFVTTYDLASQAQAQLLREVLSSHKPVANAAIVMMEPPRSAGLAQVWADSLGLKWPIAMASPTLMAGDSQLGRINGVPTIIVLDRRGRVIAKSDGALDRAAIKDCLTRADAR